MCEQKLKNQTSLSNPECERKKSDSVRCIFSQLGTISSYKIVRRNYSNAIHTKMVAMERDECTSEFNKNLNLNFFSYCYYHLNCTALLFRRCYCFAKFWMLNRWRCANAHTRRRTSKLWKLFPRLHRLWSLGTRDLAAKIVRCATRSIASFLFEKNLVLIHIYCNFKEF